MLLRKSTQYEPVELAVKQLAEFFRALSNNNRILIIEELADGEKDVSSIAAALQLQQSAVSKHLAVLHIHKLVDERKEGRSVFYRLSDLDIVSWMGDGARFAVSNSDNAESSSLELLKTERSELNLKE